MPLADPTAPPGNASRLSPGGKYRALKQAGLVLLCAAWILLGLFGHDPWKPDDATTFGVAHDVLSNGDWLAPQLAGAPAAVRPPLFYALAAARTAATRLRRKSVCCPLTRWRSMRWHWHRGGRCSRDCCSVPARASPSSCEARP